MRSLIRSHRFLSHFPAAQGAKLEKLVRLVRFPHRAVIFEEGSVSDCVYLVLTGRVALMKKSAVGTAQLIAHKGPDDYFGELGVLDGSPRSTAAIADGPVQLGRLAQRQFIQLLSESSWHTVLRLFSHVSENLRATNERYVSEVMRKEKITLIGEMANSMIHDFRAPFSTIKLATELIAKRNQTPQNQELCRMILRQVDRLGGMVEEVLDFARGETRLKQRAVPLQESLHQLHENNLEALARAGIRLTFKPTPLVVSLDSDRFQRVMQNLVTNAREALTGRPGAKVAVSAKREGRFATVSVADNGPGIPREIRETLFEPFVSRGKPNGTGLGLAIARSVIDAHGGSIEFKTSRQGTTFLVRVPLA
ncbi:cyclic nucleotide-binding domain-containing protein [Oleiharenicola lentus]|uniref:histidine kinase n=1 Tax=Oleiharenicola lentus TaxID=2508720 RepID=A0A4Q1CCS4_9BACT|nr:ATP-binding protein [Oleiharenicola lentus]RXK56712.1 cyclic nucleotide-binding domain-containing protein [Oleiharenicola lentus]